MFWKLFKRRRYKIVQGTKNMKNYEMYKKTKKEAKKVVSEIKLKAYGYLYNRLGTREREHDIFFYLIKIRERKSTDLDHVKYIESNDQKSQVKENDIKERWR